ncbi:hypothetical protein [Chryseobacterium sp.]|uniref:hypothetical protein n=1 Tax=Chryseobacterium sp. TaxID=1871047 RepID=UPI0012A8626E|nr:hypothetical protein [Chryseobacterium sp.]QFG54459.1 hypothetical protein F7R58_12650 [Chryseobacterium sp.]
MNLTFDPIACAYFAGYAFGFIISLIIEIILTVIATGTTLTIPVIVEKLSEALFEIFRLAWKNSVKIVRTFSKFVVKSIEDVIKGVQELLNFLKKGWDEVVNSAADEIILFLETDQDESSNQKLYRKVSEKVRKTYVDTATGKLYRTFFEGNIIDTVQKYLSQANKEIIEDLLIRGYVEDRGITAGFLSGFKYVLLATSAPAKALGWVMNKLGNGIDFLKISDEFWDTESEEYYFNKDKIIKTLSISTDKLSVLKTFSQIKRASALPTILRRCWMT